MVLTIAAVLLIAIAGLVLINTGNASADVTSVTTTDQIEASTNSQFGGAVMPSLLKMFSALVVVLFCIYGSIFFLKKVMGKKLSGNKINKTLEVLETTYLAPKKSISLVRIANRSVLVGVTEQQISVLTELTDEETSDLILSEETAEEKTPVKGFKEMLSMASSKVREFNQKGKPAIAES